MSKTFPPRLVGYQDKPSGEWVIVPEEFVEQRDDTEWISKQESDALVRQAKAEVLKELSDYYFDQAQMCVDTDQDPGGCLQVAREIEQKAAELRAEEGEE